MDMDRQGVRELRSLTPRLSISPFGAGRPKAAAAICENLTETSAKQYFQEIISQCTQLFGNIQKSFL